MGHRNQRIDVSRYPANAALLDWCLDCLPFRAADRRRGQDVPAKRKADSIPDRADSSSARSSTGHNYRTEPTDSLTGGLPRRGSRMPEDADSMAGGPRRRGSGRPSDMDSMAGGAPRRGLDSQSDDDSMVGGPPRGGLGGQNDVDSPESFDERDYGSDATDPHCNRQAGGYIHVVGSKEGPLPHHLAERRHPLRLWSYQS